MLVGSVVASESAPSTEHVLSVRREAAIAEPAYVEAAHFAD